MSTLTRDQIVSLVLSRAGKRETNSYLVAAANLELQLLQDTILEKGPILPWFLLSAETAIPLTVAGGRLAGVLPADFLREWDEYGGLRLKDSTTTPPTYTELNKNDFDLAESKFGSNAAGTPQEYDLVGSSIAVFPLCTVDVTAAMIYFKKQAVLDSVSNPTNAWTVNAADLLIAELGVRMTSTYIMGSPAAQQFQTDRTAAWTRIQTEDLARKNAAREAFRGD
jgi:hypothetical protein